MPISSEISSNMKSLKIMQTYQKSKCKKNLNKTLNSKENWPVVDWWKTSRICLLKWLLLTENTSIQHLFWRQSLMIMVMNSQSETKKILENSTSFFCQESTKDLESFIKCKKCKSKMTKTFSQTHRANSRSLEVNSKTYPMLLILYSNTLQSNLQKVQ